MDDESLNNLFDMLAKVPDFNDLLKSPDFCNISHPEWIMRDKLIKIEGDIRSINIGQFNRLSMTVMIDNTHDGIVTTTVVGVMVPDNLREQVLKLRPDTGIRLTAKYQKLNVITHCFELVEILESDMDLHFPYCICASDIESGIGCGEILGYAESDYSDFCPMCGSATKMVYNVYKDMKRKE